MSTTVESTVEIRPYEKRLEGVQATKELVDLWKECYTQVQFGSSTTSRSGGSSGKIQKSLTVKDALRILKENPHPNQGPQFVPIHVLQALDVLLGDETDKLEKALKQ